MYINVTDARSRLSPVKQQPINRKANFVAPVVLSVEMFELHHTVCCCYFISNPSAI